MRLTNRNAIVLGDTSIKPALISKIQPTAHSVILKREKPLPYDQISSWNIRPKRGEASLLTIRMESGRELELYVAEKDIVELKDAMSRALGPERIAIQMTPSTAED